MLYNIFKSKSKSEKVSKKPQIIIDTREKNSLIESYLVELGADVEAKQLEIGDYIIGDIVIERKTFSDFISSMLSKRLIQQLDNLQSYKRRLLILEGKDFEDLKTTKINPNAIRGMILSISLDHNTPIIFTKDSEDTAKTLVVLAKRQLKNPQETSLHSRKGKTKKEKLEYILESFEGIGPKNAQILLKNLGSIKNILNTSQEELEKLIGKKADVFRIADEKY